MLDLRFGRKKTLIDTVQDVRSDLTRSQRNFRDAIVDATADLTHVAKTGGRERYKRDWGFWPGFIGGFALGGIVVSLVGLMFNRRHEGVLGYRMPSEGLNEEVESGRVGRPHNDREKVETEEKREVDDRARDIAGRETSLTANEPRETTRGALALERLQQTP
jgi:hypothetical protein